VAESHSRTRKALIIGLDGATFDVIDPLLADGKLPNIKALMSEGVYGRLRSTLPPNSAPAWTAFLTGKNPAQYGILDFRYLDFSSYAGHGETFVSSAAFAGETLLDAVGNAGLGVVAYRIPMTYPVWPLSGVMVAGYPTPDRKMAYTHPPELAEELGPLALHSHDEILRAGVDEERRNADYEIECIERTMIRYMETGEHALYVCVSGITDGFQHKFWRLRDPSHPLYDSAETAQHGDIISQYYQKLDGMVGRLLDHAGPEWLVVVMSDHGGGTHSDHTINLNAWLRQEGLLKVREGGSAPLRRSARNVLTWARQHFPFPDFASKHLPDRLKTGLSDAQTSAGLIDWSKTQAYRLQLQHPAQAIEVNLRGRQPEGIVEPGEEYEALRSMILARITGLRDPETDRPLVLEAHRREDVYSGKYLEDMPDIVVLYDATYYGGDGVDLILERTPRSLLSRLSGDHVMDGVFFMRSEGVVRRGQHLEGSEIVDVAPTVLHLMGLPVPSDMDGHVLMDALETEAGSIPEVRIGEALGQSIAASAEADYSDDDEAGIRKALEGLGYL